MLNGIGGRTIAEAKERMPYDEYLAWCAYIAKRGSLNLGTRIEFGVALLATVIRSANGQRASMSDFLPKRGEDEQPSAKSVFAMLKAKAAVNNRARKRKKG